MGASRGRAHGARLERHDRLVAALGVLGSGSNVADEERRSLVAATRDGWWVSVLLHDGRRMAAFHTDRDLLDGRIRTDPRAWLDALLSVPLLGSLVAHHAHRPPERIHVIAADSRRLRWPPGEASGVGEPGTARPALLAVGDSDMAFDPLSSAGIGAAVASAGETVPVIEALLGSTSSAHVRTAVGARAAASDARWRAYRARLREAYQDEDRWPRSPFWARRAGAGP